ncbi:acidic leucine-rich nuclear phosphoprotein 32 family member B [Diaphorina citri]|uniref:Acidic leucine-rich nuclear phosphoprotein 32 family member B n=1 Tax=Diaphorina citri TaxID=121845 RepID=A0A1S3D9P4_DIACI|nr:acidic leucine-rich nuclear phosphoprotein 32 family member B [Diaphorina citri]
MMDAEHAEISAKRKHEDTDNDLVSVKKIKTEVEESGPQNGEVTEESVGEGKQLSNGLDQSEDESLQGSDADKTLLNNSGELSEDESGSDDENDTDESDEESGEEEEDEHNGLMLIRLY